MYVFHCPGAAHELKLKKDQDFSKVFQKVKQQFGTAAQQGEQEDECSSEGKSANPIGSAFPVRSAYATLPTSSAVRQQRIRKKTTLTDAEPQARMHAGYCHMWGSWQLGPMCFHNN